MVLRQFKDCDYLQESGHIAIFAEENYTDASCIIVVIVIVRICKFVLLLVCLELLLLLGICGCDVIDIDISIHNVLKRNIKLWKLWLPKNSFPQHKCCG